MNILTMLTALLLSQALWAQSGDIDSLFEGSWGGTQGSQKGSPKPIKSEESVDMSCKDKTQKSIPFYLFAGLLDNKGRGINYSYNGVKNQLTVDFGLMMDACDQYISFVANSEPEEKRYFLEVRLRAGKSYDDFKSCALSNMEKGVPKDIKKTSRKKIVFNNIKPDHEILYMSEGPFADQKTLYDVAGTNGCKVYEKISTQPMYAKQFDFRYIDEKEKLAKLCESGDYQKILANVGEFENFRGILEKIAAGLIDEKTKEAVALIRSKKIGQVDFDVFDDFEKFVINPLVDEIERSYSELAVLEVGSKGYDKKKRELDKLKRELGAYSRDPYADDKVRDRLLAEGYFSEEALVFRISTKIAATRKIFNNEDGVVIDPALAEEIQDEHIADHNSWLDEQRKNFRIQKGEITGESEKFYSIAEAYERELAQEMEQYQAGSALLTRKLREKCFQPYKNTASCVRMHEQMISDFTEIHKENKANIEAELKTYYEKGDFYAALEAKARGGEIPERVEKTDERPKYTFDYEAMVAEHFPEQENQQQYPQQQYPQQQYPQQRYPQQQYSQQQYSQQQYSQQGPYANYYQQYNQGQMSPYTFQYNGAGRGVASGYQQQQYPQQQYPQYQQRPNYYQGQQPGLSTPGYNGAPQYHGMPPQGNPYNQGYTNPYQFQVMR